MTLLKSAAKITPKSIPITIYLSSLLNFGVTAGGGCPLAGEVAADVKSDNIIEISGPYNLKIDTHNDIFVIYFEFVLQRAVGDPLTAGGAADIKSKIIIENHQNRHPVNPDAISFEFWWGGGCPLAGGGAADVKSDGIIEISGPNNPKIDTRNDMSVITLNFGVTAGGGCPLAGGGRKI